MLLIPLKFLTILNIQDLLSTEPQPMENLFKIKIPIGLEFNSCGSFPLRDKILGPQGQYFQHIISTTGVRYMEWISFHFYE